MPTILIVEDEKNLRHLYEAEFTEAGYTVLLASMGAEAVAMAEEQQPDLVIMDIRMPEINGIEAMKRMLAQNKDIPVIINSAYQNFQDDFNTWAAKAYVLKSSDLTELKSRVEEFIPV